MSAIRDILIGRKPLGLPEQRFRPSLQSSNTRLIAAREQRVQARTERYHVSS
jgi:hypothetical protein